MSDDSRRAPQENRGLAHWIGQVLESLGVRSAGTVREEIAEALAGEAEAGTDFSPQERAMLVNVLGLHKRRVADAMVPRTDIAAVSIAMPLGELLGRFSSAGHSRLPVYGETLDDPRGMIHIRDFLDYVARRSGAGADDGPAPDLAAVDLSLGLGEAQILRPVLYVPPSMPAVDLLVRMQATRTHIALVIDEYGGTDGLVSIEDLIELVVGDIEDEHDLAAAPSITRTDETSYVADARATLDELHAATGIDLSRSEMAEDVDTLGGLIVTLAGRVPVSGERVPGPEGLEFEIVEADARRIKQLRIHRHEPTEAGAATPDLS